MFCTALSMLSHSKTNIYLYNIQYLQKGTVESQFNEVHRDWRKFVRYIESLEILEKTSKMFVISRYS